MAGSVGKEVRSGGNRQGGGHHALGGHSISWGLGSTVLGGAGSCPLQALSLFRSFSWGL